MLEVKDLKGQTPLLSDSPCTTSRVALSHSLAAGHGMREVTIVCIHTRIDRAFGGTPASHVVLSCCVLHCRVHCSTLRHPAPQLHSYAANDARLLRRSHC